MFKSGKRSAFKSGEHASSLFQQLYEPVSTQRESRPINLSIQESLIEKCKLSSDPVTTSFESSQFSSSLERSEVKKINFERYMTQGRFTLRNKQSYIDGTSGSVHGYKHKHDKNKIGETLCRNLVGQLPQKPHVQVLQMQSVDKTSVFTPLKSQDSVFSTNLSCRLSQNNISQDQYNTERNCSAQSSALGQSRIPETVKVRVEKPFKPKEIKQLREEIRNKISSVFDSQIARATSIEWKNHSASTKCNLQSKDELPTTHRKKLVKFLTEKRNQNQRSESISESTKQQNKLPVIENESKFFRRATFEQRLKKKVMQENIQYLQNFSMVDQPEQMRQVLHLTTRYDRARQNFNTTPLCYQYASSQYVKQKLRDELKRTIAAQFHEKSDLQKRYEYLDNLERQKKIRTDQKNRAAALTKVFPHVTGEDVAAMLTDTPQQRGLTMISRQKPWISEQDQEKLQFESKVLTYCQELTEQDLYYEEPKIAQKSKKKVGQLKSSRIKYFSRMGNDEEVDNQFDDFVIKCSTDKPVKNIAMNLLDKLNFQQLCKMKQMFPQGTQLLTTKDPNTDYFVECKKNIVPAIDLLNKIRNKTLIIENYTLQLGQCKGFMQACKIDEDLIQRMVIRDCGMTDQLLDEIISGLCLLKKVKILNLVREEIGPKSLEALKRLFQKTIPLNFESLRIEHCKISPPIVENLLQSLTPNGQINKLELIGVEFNDQGLKLLAEFISASRQLTSIDLSFCQIPANKMMPIFRAICESRRLQNINLSWNSLCENPNYAPVGSFCQNFEELQSRKTFRKRKEASQKLTAEEKRIQKMLGIEDKKKPNRLNEQEKEVVELLQKMLIKNTKLIHLDLSETMLNEDMLIDATKGLKYAQNLLAVHLSGNPGLTYQVMQKILSRLNAFYEKPVKLESFNQLLNRFQEPKDNKEAFSPAEALKIKEIVEEKRMYQPCDVGKFSDPQRRHFILSRKVGHYLDIPGSDKWQLNCDKYSDCYVCDRKIYSFFFWSPQLGRIETRELNLTLQEQAMIINEIEKGANHKEQRVEQLKLVRELSTQSQKQRYDPQTGTYVDDGPDDSSENDLLGSQDDINAASQTVISNISDEKNFDKTMDSISSKLQLESIQSQPNLELETQKEKPAKYQVPYIYGQFNNWMPQQLVKMSRFVKVLNKDMGPKPDFLKELRLRGEIRENVNEIKDMSRRERQRYERHLMAYNRRFNKKNVWEKFILKFIAYKQPNLVGASKLNQIDSSKIFIGATFMDAGRQPYVVKYQDNYYFHQAICNFRREDIVFPKLDAQDIQKVERNPQVFNQWIIDTEKIYEKCCKYDFEGWKLKNFVKDPGDQQDIQTIINEEYGFLKDVFTSIAIKSNNWPNISQLDFASFFDNCKVPDKNTSLGIIDTQYIACKTDSEKRNMKTYGQRPDEINRFEFLEAIVRVANCKYKQQNQGISWAEAVKQMIEQIKQNFTPHELQSFRYHYLWNRDCNLVFDANKVGIMALYTQYCGPKTKKVTFENAMRLMTQDSTIKLSVTGATICYGSSLMTCADIVKLTKEKFYHIEFLEFMEMIGRVAHQYFIGNDSDQKPLCDKIAYVLDEYLAIIGLQREDAQPYEDGVVLQSDQSDPEADVADTLGGIELPAPYD